MTVLADLLAKRAALISARSSGLQRTTFRSGGTERTVWYKSDAEMAEAIAALDAEIAAQKGPRVRTFLPTFSKGT